MRSSAVTFPQSIILSTHFLWLTEKKFAGKGSEERIERGKKSTKSEQMGNGNEACDFIVWLLFREGFAHKMKVQNSLSEPGFEPGTSSVWD